MGNERCQAPLVTTPTRELAAFLTDLNGRVDARLLRLANDYLLDTIGCMIYGSTKPWAQMATAHALRTGGTGSSGVIASDCTTTPAMAAFANGAAAHAFELDDVHEEAISHPGAVVIPAVLAVADEIDASGRDIHEAIVVGYEAMGRAGIAVGPASHMLSGFHPTSMSGTFGSAAAVGRLLDFDATTMNHAIGIAASMASGTMEFASSGGMTKRIHAARAAEGGVTAALLAAEGFEGSNDGLAGKYGFCRIFTNNPQLHLLTRDLGNRWMTDEITIKPYAACSDIHPMIQATVELRAEHGF
ncbi:MAG: MmgE/PrpD family protein, partial [Actinomycetota bacterium]|nr:MmgE/PrpD family protein [Actinomycetota bacterium]